MSNANVNGLGIIDAIRSIMSAICTVAGSTERVAQAADNYVSIAEKHSAKTLKSYSLEWDAEIAQLDAQLKANATKALPAS